MIPRHNKVSATTVIQTDLKMAKPWIWRIAYGEIEAESIEKHIEWL